METPAAPPSTGVPLGQSPGFTSGPLASFGTAPASVIPTAPDAETAAATFVAAEQLAADGTVPAGVVPEPVPQIDAAALVAMQQQLLLLQAQLAAIGIGPADVETQKRVAADTRLHVIIDAGTHEGVEVRIGGASGYVGADGSWRPN